MHDDARVPLSYLSPYFCQQTLMYRARRVGLFLPTNRLNLTWLAGMLGYMYLMRCFWVVYKASFCKKGRELIVLHDAERLYHSEFDLHV